MRFFVARHREGAPPQAAGKSFSHMAAVFAQMRSAHLLLALLAERHASLRFPPAMLLGDPVDWTHPECHDANPHHILP